MKDELYNKERSTTSCIRAAFNYYNKNAMKILRMTWIPALLAAILGNIPTALLSSPELATMSAHKLLTYISIASISFILSIFVYILFRAKIYSMFNGQPTKKNYIRNISVFILSIILFSIVILCSTGFSFGCNSLIQGHLEGHASLPLIIKCLTGIVFVVLIVIALPFTLANTLYLIEPSIQFSDIFRKGYKTGWKNWGYLFAIMFVCAILTSIAYCIVFSPSMVLFLASEVNLYGIALGDANGLPASFSALAFAMTTLSTLIFAYVDVWLILVFYYTCGHIETCQKRKKADLKK